MRKETVKRIVNSLLERAYDSAYTDMISAYAEDVAKYIRSTNEYNFDRKFSLVHGETGYVSADAVTVLETNNMRCPVLIVLLYDPNYNRTASYYRYPDNKIAITLNTYKLIDYYETTDDIKDAILHTPEKLISAISTSLYHELTHALDDIIRDIDYEKPYDPQTYNQWFAMHTERNANINAVRAHYSNTIKNIYNSEDIADFYNAAITKIGRTAQEFVAAAEAMLNVDTTKLSDKTKKLFRKRLAETYDELLDLIDYYMTARPPKETKKASPDNKTYADYIDYADVFESGSLEMRNRLDERETDTSYENAAHVYMSEIGRYLSQTNEENFFDRFDPYEKIQGYVSTSPINGQFGSVYLGLSSKLEYDDEMERIDQSAYGFLDDAPMIVIDMNPMVSSPSPNIATQRLYELLIKNNKRNMFTYISTILYHELVHFLDHMWHDYVGVSAEKYKKTKEIEVWFQTPEERNATYHEIRAGLLDRLYTIFARNPDYKKALKYLHDKQSGIGKSPQDLIDIVKTKFLSRIDFTKLNREIWNNYRKRLVELYYDLVTLFEQHYEEEVS